MSSNKLPIHIMVGSSNYDTRDAAVREISITDWLGNLERDCLIAHAMHTQCTPSYHCQYDLPRVQQPVPIRCNKKISNIDRLIMNHPKK